jgi:hypothetical protein
MRFFFYGTLLDDALRRVVARKHYPIIRRDAAASVAGAVTDTLGARDIARLRHYEGDGYELVAARIHDQDGADIAAQVFVPPEESGLVGAGDWNLDDWRREHRAAVLGRLRAYRWPPG